MTWDYDHHCSVLALGKNAWIDVNSPRFFLFLSILYIVVMESGTKPVIPPTRV